MNRIIKVGIAENHRIFASSLEVFLNTLDDLEVVFTVNDGQELIEIIDTVNVDVILLDIEMPILDGRKAIKLIRKKKGFDIKVIILSMYYSNAHITNMMKLGANAYLSKDVDVDVLIKGINEVVKTGVFFHDRVNPEVVCKSLLSDKPMEYIPVSGEILSKSELVVIKLLSQGKTCNQIAKELNRSLRTIENHRYRIMKKLNVSNAMELMEALISHGIHDIKI